jgi:hypothetical protein
MWMATTEHTINDSLANLLRRTRWLWHSAGVVRSENTGSLRDSAGRPDVLIVEKNVTPVVIETEVDPAPSVESDALDRLGKTLKHNGRRILSSVAVRLPSRLRDFEGEALTEQLAKANDLQFVLYTGTDESDATRWPPQG